MSADFKGPVRVTDGGLQGSGGLADERVANSSAPDNIATSGDAAKVINSADTGFFRNVDRFEAPKSTLDFKYPPGFVISVGRSEVGTIVGKVGQGAMGDVYKMRLVDGSFCAAKTIKADLPIEKRRKEEEKLANEVTFGFAMGRSPLVMAVIRTVMALPGTTTTAKGLLLLCDFVDGGDLEEAMSTKEAVRKAQPDYKGDLWEAEATRWPVASITLQIFMAFEHCHARGVSHQVRLQLK